MREGIRYPTGTRGSFGVEPNRGIDRPVARVEHRADGRGAEDDPTAGQRPHTGPLTLKDPGPDRIQHRLDQEDERRLERRHRRQRLG